MDYEEMSDFEINKQVAINRGGYQGHVEHMQHGVKESDRASHGLLFTERDYCNNPSDAWPIIHGNDIMLNPNCADELWKAEQGFREKPSGFYDVATAHNKNPLRAAMIVFLMMRDEQCQKS